MTDKMLALQVGLHRSRKRSSISGIKSICGYVSPLCTRTEVLALASNNLSYTLGEGKKKKGRRCLSQYQNGGGCSKEWARTFPKSVSDIRCNMMG